MIRLALLFYGGCTALAFGIGALAGRPGLALWPRNLAAAGLGAAVGLGLGLGVVALSSLALRRWTWGRQLADWFAGLLGPLSGRQALLLALLSSLGEELLFRGALQPLLGLLVTSLIFGLLHFPPQLRFWPWTLSAGLLGLGFGAMVELSGNLGGPLLAHFIINWLNLKAIGPSAQAGKICPPLPPPPSIDGHEASRAPESPPPASGPDLDDPDGRGLPRG